MAKLDEYRIERYPNGKWGALYGPNQRVRVYGDLEEVMCAMAKGLPKDHPRLTMIQVELHDGRFEDWPPYEGKP